MKTRPILIPCLRFFAYKAWWVGCFCLFLGGSLFAQSYPRVYYSVSEGEEANCENVGLVDENHSPIPPPEKLKSHLNCQSDIKQSGEVNGRYLAWVDFPEILLYDFETDKTSQLMTVFTDSEGISSIQWEDNGDGNDTTELVFFNINRKRYAAGTKMFLLSIADGQLIEKYSDEVNAGIICEGGQCELEGFSFYDAGISYISGDPADRAAGLKVRTYLHLDEFEEMTVFNTGFDNWWAMASTYFFELMGPNGKVALPKEVESAFFRHGKAKISENGRRLYYLDEHNQVLFYDFDSKRVTNLFKLPETEEDIMFSRNLFLSPSGNTVVVVDENEAVYPLTGQAVYLLSIEGGHVTHSQAHEVEARNLYRVRVTDEGAFFKGKHFFDGETKVICPDGKCEISLK